MTQTPASDPAVLDSRFSINMLAQDIAVNGMASHESTLRQLADAAEQSALLPGAAAVLCDPDSPEAARGRAFLTIARQWPAIVAALTCRVAFDTSFAEMAEHWSRHQDLRPSGQIAELAISRERLDQLRQRAREHASSLH